MPRRFISTTSRCGDSAACCSDEPFSRVHVVRFDDAHLWIECCIGLQDVHEALHTLSCRKPGTRNPTDVSGCSRNTRLVGGRSSSP